MPQAGSTCGDNESIAGQKQHSPRISVVMTAYNDLRFIDVAVMSLLRQTYKDFELIIVDDGTNRPEIFSRLAALDPRVRVITCEQNNGTTAAANRGIAESRGEIVARLDADDIAEPHRLARLFALFDSDPALGLVGSWAKRISEEGEPLDLWRLPVSDFDIRWTILFYTPICHTSSAYLRSCFDRAGGYNAAMRQSGDHDLWWRMLDTCRAQNIPEPLVRYRRNSRGLSASNPPNWRQRTEHLRHRAWSRLGIDYDADLHPHLSVFISGGTIPEPKLRVPAYRTVLELLDRFLATQPLLREEDFAEAREIKSRIVGRILADRAIGFTDSVQLLPLCLRISPIATLRGLAKSFVSHFVKLFR
jgi:glycosyltransferase involved in cell wall biosynthesis